MSSHQSPATEREQAERIAERIVEVLFTAGDKAVADRIALKQRIQQSPRKDVAGERDLGGWSREAATRQVLAVLLATPYAPVSPAPDRVRALVARIDEWSGNEHDDQPIEFIAETILPALRVLLAASPETPRPPDFYRSGEPMPQYATLGIGVDAWVDLTEQEKPRTDGRRPSDSVIVKRSTFDVVMRVLRAVRIADFKIGR